MNRHYPKICMLALAAFSMTACDSSDKTFMVGTLERDRVEVKVESNEPIVAIAVQDGQMLSAGDLIMEQDPTRLQAVVAQQSAQRDQALARLAELQRGPRPESIRQARALLASSQASSKNAAADLKRRKDLFNRNLSDQRTLDTAQTRWETASAAQRAAKEALQALVNGTTREVLDQAKAAVAVSEALLSQAQLNLQRLKIYAPVNGMLDKRLFQIGERPQPGTTVAVILDSSRSFARIYVPEPIRASVQPGRLLKVRIDGVKQPLSGTVRWVSSDASFTPYFALTEHDRSRLSYLAEVDLSGADSLPSGLPLEVDFPAGHPASD